MIRFFEYNWQVRDEWFAWCRQWPDEELTKERNGGVGNILHTLFHIAEVEYSWLRGMQGKEDIVSRFEDYGSLDQVKAFSDRCRNECADFIPFNRY